MKTTANNENKNLNNKEEQIMKTSSKFYQAILTIAVVLISVSAVAQNKEQLTNQIDLIQMEMPKVDNPKDHPVKNPIHIMDGIKDNGINIGEAGTSERSTMAAPGDNVLRGKSVLDNVAVEHFHNYPNPFVKQTTIEYEVIRASYVQLRVSYRGQLVKIISSDFHDVGRYRVSFDAEGMPAGTYHAALIVNGQEISKSIYKIR